MQRTSLLSFFWVRYNRFMPHLRRVTLLLTASLITLLDLQTLLTSPDRVSVTYEVLQIFTFIIYIYIKKLPVGMAGFTTVLVLSFITPNIHPSWGWILVYAIIVDLIATDRIRLAILEFSILFLAQISGEYALTNILAPTILWGLMCSSIGIILRRAKERLEQIQQEAERSKEIAAELIQQLRRDIADSLHDDLAADLTRMLIISRSIKIPNGDDRDRILDLQDRIQQALSHLRLLIHNLAVSQGLPKEEPTLQEIIDSSAATLSQREIVLDADLDGIEKIPSLHRSEPGRLLVAFIRENTLNALKYNSPHDLVSLFVEHEQDTLFISCSSPWRAQEVPEEMRGGYGLLALQDRFESAGGSLSSNRIGTSWTVLASLPWNEIAIPTTNARSLMSPPEGAAYA